MQGEVIAEEQGSRGAEEPGEQRSRGAEGKGREGNEN
jgi:hypothetical protein